VHRRASGLGMEVPLAEPAALRLISQVPPVAAAPCLRHLALALAAGVEARAAQALLNALATILRRDSEDMRAFALTQPWTDQESGREWS